MWPLRTIPGAALSADGGVDCAAKKHNGLNIGLQAGLDRGRYCAGIAIQPRTRHGQCIDLCAFLDTTLTNNCLVSNFNCNY